MPPINAPRWDLSNVYPTLESAEFQAALQGFQELVKDCRAYLAERVKPAGPGTAPPELAELLGGLVQRLNQALERSQTLRAYISSFVTTDSYNSLAQRLYSQYEKHSVELQQALVQAEKWIGSLGEALQAALQADARLEAYRFFLEESAQRSRYLMSEAEEALASELGLSGSSAWHKLQGKVVSQLSAELALDGRVQKLSMPELINLRAHPQEDVRRRAYEAEMTAWESVQETLAAAMNGVKGSAITLDRRRGRPHALHSALELARIDEGTLEAMLEAVRGALPAFRRFFHLKASLLGKPRLAWWDLFAPLGANERSYSFAEAQTFILEQFGAFDADLALFARRAFDGRWIDAEQRIGKRAGAFCMGVPEVRESRILSNFDGTLDQVFTVAHELGHGFHNSCMFQSGRSALQRTSPMTMNETASIMCETIAFQAALAQASSAQEKLAILDTSLSGDAQVVVDIYSRFLFERQVFEQRAQAELSANELNELMLDAQRQAYGDGLDERFLHRYMWTWKPHYYYPALSFYNFPYTFGLLFGIGLYAIYQQRGPAFVADYKELLASTGLAAPAELAQRFGIDIRTPAFWQASLSVIEDRIEQMAGPALPGR